MFASISLTAPSSVDFTSAPFMMSLAAFSKVLEITGYAGVSGRASANFWESSTNGRRSPPSPKCSETVSYTHLTLPTTPYV